MTTKTDEGLGTLSVSGLEVRYLPVGKLKTNPQNARTHSKRQIRQIADSVREFGFASPLLVDRRNIVVAGHGRLAAAKLLGMREVPAIRLDHLSPDQIRGFALADNRLGEKAGWDRSILAIELQHLLTLDSDFDVAVTGFEVPEIDLLLAKPDDDLDQADVFEIDDTSQTTTRPGDLWLLGKHRIFCGSALSRESFGTLMAGRQAAIAFTDPPYNVPIDGHASGNGKIRHRDFQMASGEMDEFEFTAFLTTSLRLIARHSTSGSVHFTCMDWRHMGELLEAGRQVYDSLLNLCVWAKSSGGMGSFYRSQHELVFVFRNGSGRHRNNIQLGRFGRNRSNIWQYPGLNSLSKQTDEGNLLALHPTVKPVALVADALLDCSAPGDIVLDGFLGSGSTVMAAERTGRRCYGIEIDPIYVDAAVKRWQRYTGNDAIHSATGRRFREIFTSNSETHGTEEGSEVFSRIQEAAPSQPVQARAIRKSARASKESR
jgi:DNA modification methylase